MKTGNGHSATRSPDHRKALREAFKLLGVFDHFVIVASTSQEHHSPQGPDPDVCWSGGSVMAEGLLRLAKRRMKYRHRFKSEPP
jgi:hypothetical protein